MALSLRGLNKFEHLIKGLIDISGRLFRIKRNSIGDGGRNTPAFEPNVDVTLSKLVKISAASLVSG